MRPTQTGSSPPLGAYEESSPRRYASRDEREAHTPTVGKCIRIVPETQVCENGKMTVSYPD